jgi:clan AA aspartic protease
MTILSANHKYRRTKGTSLTGGEKMGLVYAEIELVNGDDLFLHRRGFLSEAEIRTVRTRALVDSGAYDLVINEEVKEQLGLSVIDRRTGRLADERDLLDMVGPVEVRFETRSTIVKALVLPATSEVLLGAIPLAGLDVIVDPVR